MKSPYFSVVVPAYNASRFLEETLASVLNQTFIDFELIIVNDGSTDNTKELVENIIDSRIQLFNIPNGGVSHARNHGISQAKGKYIAFLDADDIWHPKHLEYAYEALTTTHNSLWYASRYERRNEAPSQWNAKKELPKKLDYFNAACLYVHSSTAIIKRDFLLKKLPVFPEDVINAEDWIAWAKIAATAPSVLFSNSITVIYRNNDCSVTNQDENTYCDKYLALSRHLRTIISSDENSFTSYRNWRTRERWQLIIAKRIITNWKQLLREFRSELGFFSYSILFIYFGFSHFLGLAVGKYLSIFSNRDTAKRYNKIINP